jgi:hypothetical protein
MKYIDADKIKAEIDKITESLTKSCNPDPLGTMEECMAAAELEALGLVKSIIDQMQQEEPLPPSIEEGTFTYEQDIRLVPMPFEPDKGPDYWKEKYRRLKERMQELINDKEE